MKAPSGVLRRFTSRIEFDLALEAAQETLEKSGEPLTVETAQRFGRMHGLLVGEDLYDCPIAFALLAAHMGEGDAAAIFRCKENGWRHYQNLLGREVVAA